MELLIMISACKGGSAKSVTGTEFLIGLFNTPSGLTLCSGYAIFPLLAPVEEETAPRCNNRSYGCKPSPHRGREPRNHCRPPRLPNAGLLQVPSGQPRRRAPPCALGAHERTRLERGRRSQQESWWHQ